MKEHPVIGDRLCGDLRVLHGVRPIVRHHHERQDGSGYPDGLAGDAIPLLAQIISIVDVFDAITTTRPYHIALTLRSRSKSCARKPGAAGTAPSWSKSSSHRDRVRNWIDGSMLSCYLGCGTIRIYGRGDFQPSG